VGRVVRMGGFRNAYNILVGEFPVKSPLLRPRCTWEDNNQMNVEEKGRGLD